MELTGISPTAIVGMGEFRKSMGITVVRLLVLENEKPTDAWQVSFHRVPKLPYTIGYFPKGPTPDDFMIEELGKIGRKNNAIFIQIEPNVLSDFKFQIENFKLLLPSHHPLFTKYTFILDITKSEEELLKSFHPKTRYNIRLAEKRGVKIAEDNSDSAFEEICQTFKKTTERQGFYAHNKTYQQTLWKIFSKNHHAPAIYCHIRRENSGSLDYVCLPRHAVLSLRCIITGS